MKTATIENRFFGLLSLLIIFSFATIGSAKVVVSFIDDLPIVIKTHDNYSISIENHRTFSLFDRANQRTMNYLSGAYSDAEVEILARNLHERCANSVYLYTANIYDGGAHRYPSGINPYTVNFKKRDNSGELLWGNKKYLDERVISRIQRRLDIFSKYDLLPIIWLIADQSPALNNLDEENYKAYFDAIVKRFDDQVLGYVVALEVEESFPQKQTLIKNISRHLRSITEKSIGIHFAISFDDQQPIDPKLAESYIDNSVDTYYHQYGFSHSAKELSRQTQKYLTEIEFSKRMKFIAAEYDASNFMPEVTTLTNTILQTAKELGREVGIGNGGNFCD